jgi:hypothetical protein
MAVAPTYVIKVFKSPAVDDEDQPEMDSIVIDRAKREVRCLTLLEGHPNVPKLVSREFDYCTLFKYGVPHPKSLLIRQEYIKSLKDITDERFEVLGLDQDPIGKEYYVDYNVRNSLVHRRAVRVGPGSLPDLRPEWARHLSQGRGQLQLPDSDAELAPGAARFRKS